MRELEFIPSWYPLLRRKRRIIVIEAWLAVFIAAVLGLWLVLSAHNVIAKESLLTVRQKQLTQSNYELQKLSELESLKRQMSDQAKLLAHLGPNVPMGRLIDTFEQLLPNGMALRDITVEFKKGFKPQVGRSTAPPEPDPAYTVEIHGVSPSDVELGNFMTQLAKTVPHWEGGSLQETESHMDGHVVLDFILTFDIKLNDGETQDKS